MRTSNYVQHMFHSSGYSFHWKECNKNQKQSTQFDIDWNHGHSNNVKNAIDIKTENERKSFSQMMIVLNIDCEGGALNLSGACFSNINHSIQHKQLIVFNRQSEFLFGNSSTTFSL